MSTVIAAIGDIHARPDARNPERYRVLDQIIGELEARADVGAVVLLGDLNHGKMTIFDKNALLARVERLGQRWPVIIVKGNHDEDGDLDYLAHVKTPYRIVVVTDARCIRIDLATGEIATLFVLAYPQKARLVAAGVSKGDVVAVGADLFELIFMHAAAQLEDARATGDLTLMVGHINIAGSRTSVGQPNIGKELELSPKHFDRLGDIPKIFGHIHYGQEIAGAWYAGSICRQTWGEIEPKRYLAVNFYDEDTEVVAHPINVPPMWHVEGDLTRDGFTWQPKAGENGAAMEPPASWQGCDVRVRYRYKASEKSVLDLALVEAPFADAVRVKVESVAVPDRDVRAPEVAAARTLPAKVAAFMKRAELAPSLEQKIAALDHADPAQLLADVDAFIARLETGAEAAVAA